MSGPLTPSPLPPFNTLVTPPPAGISHAVTSLQQNFGDKLNEDRPVDFAKIATSTPTPSSISPEHTRDELRAMKAQETKAAAALRRDASAKEARLTRQKADKAHLDEVRARVAKEKADREAKETSQTSEAKEENRSEEGIFTRLYNWITSPFSSARGLDDGRAQETAAPTISLSSTSSRTASATKAPSKSAAASKVYTAVPRKVHNETTECVVGYDRVEVASVSAVPAPSSASSSAVASAPASPSVPPTPSVPVTSSGSSSAVASAPASPSAPVPPSVPPTPSVPVTSSASSSAVASAPASPSAPSSPSSSSSTEPSAPVSASATPSATQRITQGPIINGTECSALPAVSEEPGSSPTNLPLILGVGAGAVAAAGIIVAAAAADCRTRAQVRDAEDLEAGAGAQAARRPGALRPPPGNASR